MNKPKQARPRPKGPNKPPSDEVLLAEIASRHTLMKAFRALAISVGCAVVLLAMWPIVHELAGDETVVSVNIALGLTLSVTLAGAAVAYWGNEHRRRANRLQDRNKHLSRDVKILQERLTANGLDSEPNR